MLMSESHVADYERDGYVVLPDLFTPREVALLREAINIDDPGSGLSDAGGRAARLSFWADTAGTIWGAASTLPRVVHNVRALLGEAPAFYHGKVTLKEAHTGGAWEWHQDYGYWYDYGFVFPRMVSVFVAIDRNDLDNGCLQVLRGSHKMGRQTHAKVGSQMGVEASRFAEIEKYFERVPVILSPGSALFFHCNTLHASGANTSDRHRRCFIMCYNALSNPQVGPTRTSQPAACPVSADDAIVRFAESGAAVARPD